MATKNFLRTYTLKCGKIGRKGFEIGNLHNATEPTLHLSFSVEKSDTETANTAKIQVWNLSDANLKILDTKDCIVELKAGYDNQNSLILVGNIISVVTTADNADRLTEIEVVDGRVALRDTVLTLSLNGNVSCQEVYQSIAKQMGLPIVFAKELSYRTLSNGFRFVGKARSALQKVARCCGHTWSIQNQVLQITKKDRPISTRGYLLSQTTGLLGIPKRITIGSNADHQESKTGWEVEYLFNGAIGINDVVQLKSKIANGYFRVHKVTMDGDNLEGDWVCIAELFEIKT